MRGKVIVTNELLPGIRIAAAEKYTIQQIVMEMRPQIFADEVNKLLLDGWRVVPGTFQVASVEGTAGPNENPQFVTNRGTTFRREFFVVLELEQERLPQ